MATRFRAYSRFAGLYDIMGGDRFSVKMVNYTFQLLKKFKFQPSRVLDLCCGTGTAATLFAEHGYSVTGLDGSADMLRMARRKVRAKGIKIQFTQQRLPYFAVHRGRGKDLESFDLVTSFYDSLNYLLKEEELKECFATVNRHLKPGGLFIFDMNCRPALKILWGDKVYAGCHGGFAWIWQSLFYEKTHQADMRTTFFTKRGKFWEMFEELHSEKAYPNGTIKRLLAQTGFEVIGFYNCLKFSKPGKKCYRIAIVARKRK
jgi:SAM-dependent methyltransferase